MKLTAREVEIEIGRIVAFLRENLTLGERAVIGVSGGLDSDVTARLVVRAIGAARLKAFFVHQSGQERKFAAHARALAAELGLALAEIDIAAMPYQLIAALAQADPAELFDPLGLVDVARAKCSLRTPIHATYQDRGCVVVGTSNRTEIECGFYVVLGDGIWHLGPIAHLYKTHVWQLAEALGTAGVVMAEQPSAGFWAGETDLEDLSYWLVNEAPIGAERRFDAREVEAARRIRAEITFERIDRALLSFAGGGGDDVAARLSGLTPEVVRRLRRVTEATRRIKHRPLGRGLEARP